jgi:hypothetical protein
MTKGRPYTLQTAKKFKYTAEKGGMKAVFGIATLLVMASLCFAGTCPAGASDCFLCGGDGIPCASTDACTGFHDPDTGLNVACACPQGKPCACYCPYSEFGLLKDELAPSDDVCAGCSYGCSDDNTLCISKSMDDVESTGGLAQVSGIDGELLVSNDGGVTWAKAAAGTKLGEGDTIRVGNSGKASIVLDDGSKLFLDGGAVLRMKELTRVKSAGTLAVVLELVKAALFSDVTKRDGTKFEIDTGVSVIGVKGTQFYVSYDPISKQSVTKVYKGNVTVAGASGSIELAASEQVTTTQSGNGAVMEFDPSEDDTPFGGGAACCAPAAIVMAITLIGAATRRNR